MMHARVVAAAHTLIELGGNRARTTTTAVPQRVPRGFLTLLPLKQLERNKELLQVSSHKRCIQKKPHSITNPERVGGGAALVVALSVATGIYRVSVRISSSCGFLMLRTLLWADSRAGSASESSVSA